MFDNLIESSPAHRPVKGVATSTLMSLVFHFFLIAGAVYTTRKAAEEHIARLMDTTLIYMEDEPPPEEPPVVTQIAPPPKGFQTLLAPVEIPTEIPAIDLSQRFDPRDYSGIGVEGGVFTGLAGGTGPIDLSQVFEEAVVDEIPERISCPSLDYPRMMQQANIEGNVLLQFIVDTTGRVERGSAEMINSTHRAFEGPARNMIARCLFRPGRVRGRAVRVLVQMPIIFALRGR